jgi:hypothetical protein
VNLGALHRYRGYIVLAGVILILWAAYYFLWPTYSRHRYIDPQDVFLATIPEARATYEVHADRDPALLKRLVRALNTGREKFVQIKLAVGGVIMLHRRHGPSILIRYGRVRPGGGMVFREAPRAFGAGRPLGVCAARALKSLCLVAERRWTHVQAAAGVCIRLVRRE